MRGGRRKPETPREEGSPAWMNTYGDMVTLLLTFFLLLFSFSNVDAEKWKAIVLAFSGKTEITAPDVTLDPNFGLDDVRITLGTPAPTVTPGNGLSDEEKQFSELYEKIKSHVHQNDQEDMLDVSKDGDLITIRITDRALFDSGEDQLRKEALDLLTDIIDIFDEYDSVIRQIFIEGHTDNVPISGSKYKSNWDLSTSRAVSVVKYCIEHSNISPMKYAASGYGEYHPISDNTTDAGRARNRRVDFLLLSTKSIGLANNQ